MIKYAKVINEETKQCQVGLGTNEQFYQSIGMTKMDVEQAYDGGWYIYGHAPQKPHNDTILDQIKELEEQITDRNLRGAILGDEWAKNKITQIEAQIQALREQLEGVEQ